MKNIEKLRVLLQHWIDHNKGHAAEFSKWQNLMHEDGENNVAVHIAGAIKAVEQANDLLGKALVEAGGPKDAGEGGHSHDHHHHHHH